MAKYFGVRYNVKVEGGTEWVTYTPYDMSKGKQVDQVTTSFIVAPESESIFEPKGRDLVRVGINEICYFKDADQPQFYREIIYRDNKNFFSGEIEQDSKEEGESE